MKTYIERFAERYYVVTSSNLHLSNDKSKAYISDDLILFDTFFDVLAVAKAIFYTGTFNLIRQKCQLQTNQKRFSRS